MDFIQDYAPWLLIAGGAAGMVVPALLTRAQGGLVALGRIFRAAEPVADGEAAVLAERRTFVDAVLTAMAACHRSGCPGGVEAAKGLLDFVDRIVPAGPQRTSTGEVKHG